MKSKANKVAGKSNNESVNNNAIDIKQAPQDRACELIKLGNVEILKKLLSDDPNVVHQFHTKTGKSLLTIAVEEGSIESVKLLISSGFNLNLVDKTGIPPILYAVKNGYNNIVEHLSKLSSIDVTESAKSENALMYACRFSQRETANLMINLGIPLTHRDWSGDDALLTAVKYQCFDIVKKLLEKGCSINTKSANGNTALIRCAFDNREDSLDFVLSCNGLEIDAKNSNEETALIVATKGGNCSILSKLLQHQASVNLSDNVGRTALFVAVAGKKEAAIDLLLNASADLNIVDVFGVSPLMLAIQRQSPIAVIEKLLLKGAYINATDKCFHTALMYACMQGSEPYISLLLSHGADSTLVNIDNKKAVDFLSSEELKSFFQRESSASMATLVQDEHRLRLGRGETPEWVRRINNKELLMPAQR
eukprot:gene31481-40883_t